MGEPAPASPTCRSCRAPIIWAQKMGGDWVPLDPEPNERGQWVLLRTGSKVMPVEPGKVYRPDAQARRYFDHHSTCDLGPSIRTFAGAMRDVARGVAEDPDQEAVRARHLEVDRIREMYPWPHR